jgi:hypothetical protein
MDDTHMDMNVQEYTDILSLIKSSFSNGKATDTHGGLE